MLLPYMFFSYFFFNATATTEIYTLSLHDALPISRRRHPQDRGRRRRGRAGHGRNAGPAQDRKSTRLNSSHLGISYAVFCLKKKKQQENVESPGLHIDHRSGQSTIPTAHTPSHGT